MLSVKNIVQNVKLIELWCKILILLHFVISTSKFFLILPMGFNVKLPETIRSELESTRYVTKWAEFHNLKPFVFSI